MEIKLMQTLKDNIKIPNTIAPSQGLSEDEITFLEKKCNQEKKFPRAFREFLSLAGEYFNGGFNYIEDIYSLQQMAKDDLEYTKMKVNRPFFAFDVWDSQYSVIFLDENKEDPNVFIVNPYLAEEGTEPLIKSANNFTFTSLVNESIRRVKNNIPF